ncbi:hypothetical protein Gasu2_35910 [Galdieria sulphuraria]|uniref:Uncharacterized protein n=1 Tax=Galdieria sulphuraria TaxID=130081 RepID=M2VVD4_GALSU|nr:uncharacterized protein Gasu_52820 [Galdieria sulphuraria]EME27181.1 hypothetical protein Gasu_52820 [Galdieria sulphuraria]GJD09334.1 hypothetical protein Gasu2_35910 [Galdieria sulphuraria]|eukprot:XP_005703701.1 hypothetical protein Gasu_52820 [Galdieria sulphuraria]
MTNHLCVVSCSPSCTAACEESLERIETASSGMEAKKRSSQVKSTDKKTCQVLKRPEKIGESKNQKEPKCCIVCVEVKEK